MSRIFWDTNLFIYLFEDYGKFSEQVAGLRRRMTERKDQLFTSTLTLGEILVKPVREDDRELAEKYTRAIQNASIVLPFDEEAAQAYARIRRDLGVKAPDAVQLACAASAGMDLFITNDDRLSGRSVPGIQFVVSLRNSPI